MNSEGFPMIFGEFQSGRIISEIIERRASKRPESIEFRHWTSVGQRDGKLLTGSQ